MRIAARWSALARACSDLFGTVPTRRRSPLSLEALEAREVPAANTWLGGTWFSGSSWSAGTTPDNGDDVIFDGSVSNANLFVPINLRSYFNSIQLINGYSGSVDINTASALQVGQLTVGSGSFSIESRFGVGAIAQTGGSIAINYVDPTGSPTSIVPSTVTVSGGTLSVKPAMITSDLDLSGGTIDQPVAGSDITVTGTFDWTGGTLNSSTNLSSVNVEGDGTITPPTSGSLSLGSSLNFVVAQPNTTKETTVAPGQIILNNSAAIVIGANYVIQCNMSVSGSVIGINTAAPLGPFQKIDITAGGKLEFTGPGTYDTNIPVENHGNLKLRGSVSVFFNAGGASYIQYSTGGLDFENGSNIHVANASIKGLVFIPMNPNLVVNAQTATFYGNFSMSEGTILFGPPIGIGTSPYVYGTFTVVGDVDWVGGTYKPSVDYTSGAGNQWIVTGKMTAAATANIEPNPQRGPNRPASSYWQVLVAGDATATLPTVAGNTGLTITAGVTGTKKTWSLQSPPA